MKNDILRRLKKSNLLIYRNFALLTAKLTLALALVAFAGCGGSGGDGGITGSGFYTVSGTVSGLVGTVVLQNNGADNLSVSANGAFTFATGIADGASYIVTVKTQPSGQTCTASNNTGTIAAANVTNVSVVCAENTFTVGGTVSGLTGTGLVLQDNSADNLSIASDGTFTFAAPVADGGGYTVTVKTQPTNPNQTCTASSNTGTIAGANVTNVSVVCATNTYTVGGTVSGLTGTGLVLQDNSADNLSIASDGTFTFAAPVADGGGYTVTVKTQPTNPNQTCIASSNTGTIAGANVTNVSVVCAVNTYSVGGTVSGLTGTVVLQDNGTNDLSISSNGTFTFSTKVADGAAYNVKQKTRPSGQNCIASSNTGTIAGANVTNVSVVCESWTGTKHLGVSGQYTEAFSVAVDSLGNVYVAGFTSGGLPGNTLTGTSDFFVTKYDPAGNLVRTRQLGVSGQDTNAYDVAVDSLGNVYVAGGTTGGLPGNTLTGTEDSFVTMYDSAGNLVRTRQLGVSGQVTRANGVAVDSLGNVYVAGFTEGGLPGNTLTGTSDFFVTTYDSAGNLVRTRQLGVSGQLTRAYGVAVDSLGNVYVAGRTTGGLPGNTLTGTEDFFVTMYDSAGNLVRTRQLGVSGQVTEAYDVAVDSLANVYVAGWTDGGLPGNTLTGTRDFFVTTYDSAGNLVRTKQLGASGQDTEAYAVVVDSSGNVNVAGWTRGGLPGNTLTGTSDFFVTKYDSAGNLVRTKQLGVSGQDTNAYDVAVDSNSNVYVAGWTNGGLDSNTLTGTEDFFVTMYDPAGNKQ